MQSIFQEYDDRNGQYGKRYQIHSRRREHAAQEVADYGRTRNHNHDECEFLGVVECAGVENSQVAIKKNKQADDNNGLPQHDEHFLLVGSGIVALVYGFERFENEKCARCNNISPVDDFSPFAPCLSTTVCVAKVHIGRFAILSCHK